MKKLLSYIKRKMGSRIDAGKFNPPMIYPHVIETNLRQRIYSTNPLIEKHAGITIHYTADMDENRVIGSLESKGYGYHVLIRRDGDTVQIAPFNRRVHHAGMATWKGYVPNRHHIAVAFMSWGWVKKRSDCRYESWTGANIPPREVRYLNGQFWHFATWAQIEALYKLCDWAKSLKLNPEMICGHDECCIPPGRKVDPGGILMPHIIPNLRKGAKDYDSSIEEVPGVY